MPGTKKPLLRSATLRNFGGQAKEKKKIKSLSGRQSGRTANKKKSLKKKGVFIKTKKSAKKKSPIKPAVIELDESMVENDSPVLENKQEQSSFTQSLSEGAPKIEDNVQETADIQENEPDLSIPEEAKDESSSEKEEEADFGLLSSRGKRAEINVRLLDSSSAQAPAQIPSESSLSAFGGQAKIIESDFVYNHESENKDQPAQVDDLKASVVGEIGISDDKKKEKIPENILEEEAEKYGKSRVSLGLYRNMAFVFVFLTVVLVAAIFYFTFVKVTINLSPVKERLSDNLSFAVYGAGFARPDSAAVSGQIEKIAIEESRVYEASGRELLGEDASGKATIINNYTKNQPLVATTRLLTPDGKLFRLRDTVNVPAGGSVEVEIYADDPGPEMAVGPTKMTIPGLWAGLQDKIYAESKGTISYGQKVKKYVVQPDIDYAVKDIKQALVEKAKKENSDRFKDYDQVLYKLDDNSVELNIGAKAREEKDSFSVSLKASVVVVAFSSSQVVSLAEAKLLERVPSDKKIFEFKKDGLVFSLESQSADQGIAVVSSSFEGVMTLNEDAEIINKDLLVGLSREQLNDYLSGLEGIESYDFSFSPAFIKKVPSLADRIKVEIK